jgi:hypothetical protein
LIICPQNYRSRKFTLAELGESTMRAMAGWDH